MRGRDSFRDWRHAAEIPRLAAMRQHGCRDSVRGLGGHDHGCLAYADDAVFAAAGAAYLRDGLELGQLAMVVAADPEDVLRRLGGTPPGSVEVLDPSEVYGVDQGAFYEAQIDRSLGAGFAGLRTLAELTPLLGDEAAGGDLARWEAQADRIMARRPWSALCCYDRRRAAPGALAEIAAVHPVGCGTSDLTSFHLFAEGDARVGLSGDVDTFVAGRLERALAHADPGAPYTIDLGAAGFLDHNAVLALTRLGNVRLEGASPLVSRVGRLVGAEL